MDYMPNSLKNAIISFIESSFSNFFTFGDSSINLSSVLQGPLEFNNLTINGPKITETLASSNIHLQILRGVVEQAQIHFHSALSIGLLNVQLDLQQTQTPEAEEELFYSARSTLPDQMTDSTMSFDDYDEPPATIFTDYVYTLIGAVVVKIDNFEVKFIDVRGEVYFIRLKNILLKKGAKNVHLDEVITLEGLTISKGEHEIFNSPVVNLNVFSDEAAKNIFAECSIPFVEAELGPELSTLLMSIKQIFSDQTESPNRNNPLRWRGFEVGLLKAVFGSLLLRAERVNYRNHLLLVPALWVDLAGEEICSVTGLDLTYHYASRRTNLPALPRLCAGKIGNGNKVMFMEVMPADYDDLGHFMTNYTNSQFFVEIKSIDINLTLDNLIKLVGIKFPQFDSSPEPSPTKKTMLKLGVTHTTLTLNSHVTVTLDNSRMLLHNLSKDDSPQGYFVSEISLLINGDVVFERGSKLVVVGEQALRSQVFNLVAQFDSLLVDATTLTMETFQIIKTDWEIFQQNVPPTQSDDTMACHICLKNTKYRLPVHLSDMTIKFDAFVSLLPECLVFVEDISLRLGRTLLLSTNYVSISPQLISISDLTISLCSDSLSRLISILSVARPDPIITPDPPITTQQHQIETFTESHSSPSPTAGQTEPNEDSMSSSVCSIQSIESNSDDLRSVHGELLGDIYRPTISFFDDDFEIIEDFMNPKNRSWDESPDYFPPSEKKLKIHVTNFRLNLYGGSDQNQSRDSGSCVNVSFKKSELVYELTPTDMKYEYFLAARVFGLEAHASINSDNFTQIAHFDTSPHQPESIKISLISVGDDLTGYDVTNVGDVTDKILRITVSPLKLTLDQKCVIFLNNFFVSVEGVGGDEAENGVFFKDVRFYPTIPVVFSYSGNWDLNQKNFSSPLMLIFQLLFAFANVNKTEISLKELHIKHGVNGVTNVVKEMVRQWVEDIKENQLGTIISSIVSLSSLREILTGIGNLVSLPYSNYKSNRGITSGIGRQSSRLGAQLALGSLNVTQGVAHVVSEVVGLFGTHIVRKSSVDAQAGERGRAQSISGMTSVISAIVEKVKNKLESEHND